MTDRILGRLGLARRAGKLAVGFDAAAAAVKDGSAALILLSADLSEKTRKEWRFQTGGYPVPVRTLVFSKEQIGAAIGAHREVGIVAVCDEGFAGAMGHDGPDTRGGMDL